MESKIKSEVRKENRIKGNLIWGILFLLEALVLVFLLVKSFEQKEVISFSQNDYEIYAGEFQENGDFYIDELSGMEGDICLSAGPLSLKKGLYRVELQFEGTGEQVCKIEDDSLGYGELLVNAFSLHDRDKTNSTGVTFRLKNDTDSLRIKIYYTGAGALWLRGITLQQTGLQYGIYLVYFLLFAGVVDLLLWMWIHKSFQKAEISTKKVGFWLIVIVVLASYPMFIDYIHLDDDVYFHFTRIEGIVQAWKAGQFPARMHPNWLNGLGYPVSIMYGDVFLWPTALLHLLGFDLMQSYKMGVVLLNFITVFVCYYCFKNMFKSKAVGLFGTAIYTLSLYRLYNIYMRGAVGEYTAMTFFPVICYGLWQIFGEDKERAKEKKNIVILIIGYSGLVLSHVLSLEFACLFTIIICVVLWKRTFRKETFWTLAIAAVISVLLSLWFLVPFLDYSMHLEMRVFNFVNHIQYKGLFVAQLLSLFQWAGAEAYMIYEGMRNVRPFGMGMAFLLSAIAFYYVWILYREKYQRSEYWGMGKMAVCLGTLASAFCLHIFPWEAIASSATVFEKVISSIQFPYRFLVIVSISFTIVGCVLLKLFMEENHKKMVAIWSGSILILTLFTAIFFMDDDLIHKFWSGLRNPEAMGSEMVSGMEYLIMDTDIENLKNLPYNRLIAGENVTFGEYEKEYSHMEIPCANQGDKESYLEANLLYYIGYHAVDRATGEQLPIVIGDEGILRVQLPAHYQGTVVIDFDGQWYWHVADWISVITLIGFVIWLVWMQRDGKMKRASQAERAD